MSDFPGFSVMDHDRMDDLVKEEKYKKEAQKWRRHYMDLARKDMCSKSNLANGESVEMACPKCGPATKLVVRQNRSNNGQFLGCPNWPDCYYTSSIPEHLLMEMTGQKGLF